jgi:hypothetical protein
MNKHIHISVLLLLSFTTSMTYANKKLKNKEILA